jgi:hypothetical protein
MNRKDTISFSQTTNFARKDLYVVPGKTPAIISIPVPNNNNNNEDDINGTDCVDNMDSECGEIQPPPLVSSEVDIDELEDDDDEQMRVAEELYRDFSMSEILGQFEVMNFNISSGTKSEIERHVREITFPRVEILV